MWAMSWNTRSESVLDKVYLTVYLEAIWQHIWCYLIAYLIILGNILIFFRVHTPMLCCIIPLCSVVSYPYALWYHTPMLCGIIFCPKVVFRQHGSAVFSMLGWSIPYALWEHMLLFGGAYVAFWRSICCFWAEHMWYSGVFNCFFGVSCLCVFCNVSLGFHVTNNEGKSGEGGYVRAYVAFSRLCA